MTGSDYLPLVMTSLLNTCLQPPIFDVVLTKVFLFLSRCLRTMEFLDNTNIGEECIQPYMFEPLAGISSGETADIPTESDTGSDSEGHMDSDAETNVDEW